MIPVFYDGRLLMFRSERDIQLAAILLPEGGPDLEVVDMNTASQDVTFSRVVANFHKGCDAMWNLKIHYGIAV